MHSALDQIAPCSPRRKRLLIGDRASLALLVRMWRPFVARAGTHAAKAGFALLFMAASVAAFTPARGNVRLWRLDCGSIRLSNLNDYDDSGRYQGRNKILASSCYLIRNNGRYLLWDAGLPADLLRREELRDGMRLSLLRTIKAQLARINVRPDQITFVGLSHYHFDHTGQVADFPKANLIVGSADWQAIASHPDRAKPLLWWVDGKGRVTTTAGDYDVFGDGTVIMLATPGHTPGHISLLVRLQQTGTVLLSGDLYHLEESRRVRAVPRFNTSRAATLASMDRFEQIAKSLNAAVILQHDLRHIRRLPIFPRAAR